MDLSQVALPPDCIEAYAMHCEVDGHNKDWIGCITQSGLICSWWGKTGSRYQQADKKGDRFQFNKLVDEKANKGYVTVDDWQPKSWRSNMFSAPITQPKETINILEKAQCPTAATWDF
jgi:hypothetical protein